MDKYLEKHTTTQGNKWKVDFYSLLGGTQSRFFETRIRAKQWIAQTGKTNQAKAVKI
jgi:hypothetical protein